MRKTQEHLQEIWQNQIDRIHRQQNIFYEKFEEMFYIQNFAEKALNAAEQIQPFALYMAAVISTLDCKRITKPSISPMEQICLQISSLEPDSKQRCKAIEKVYYIFIVFLLIKINSKRVEIVRSLHFKNMFRKKSPVDKQKFWKNFANKKKLKLLKCN